MSKEKPEKVIERFGFGVQADRDVYPMHFTNSPRILIISLENRKNVVSREYVPNPFYEIIMEKYPVPTPFGEKCSSEEMEIYTKLAHFIKEECRIKYIHGKHINFFLRLAFDKINQFFNDTNEKPQVHIDRIIEARTLAGFPK
jgi:hypothetical protein